MIHPFTAALRSLPRSLGRHALRRHALGRLLLGGMAVIAAITVIAQPPTVDSQTLARVLAASGPQIYLPIVGNQWPAGLHEVGNAGGSLGPMAIAGRYAYVAEGRQVNVYAIDGPDSPRRVGSSPRLPADVKDLTSQGPYLFVKVGDNNFVTGTYEVFDIGEDAVKDPLRSAGRVESLRDVTDVTFHGETGYICDRAGVRAMDARDPLHMLELGALPLTDGVMDCQRSDSGVLMVQCIRKCGNQASAAPDRFLWRAIDVRDPSAMRVIETIGDDYIPGGGESAGYLLAGDTLYLETVSHGTGQSAINLRRVDISDPLAWHFGGRLFLGSVQACNGFGAADGTRVYASGRSTCVYDWSDAAAETPRLTATVAAGNMAARGDRLVVVNEDLNVFDVADVDAPRMIGSVGLVGTPSRVAARSRALITLSGQRVSEVDVGQPALPHVIATWDAASCHDEKFNPIPPSMDHTLPPHRLPVYDGRDLNVLDLDHPSSPLQSKATQLFDTPAPGVVAAQDHLAVVASEGTLRSGGVLPGAIVVVQHDLPEGPRVIGRLDLTQVQALNPDIHFTSGRLVGTRAYFTTNEPPTLAIVDLTQPSAPAVLNWVPLTGDPAAVAVRGGVAYVAAGATGLHIVPVAVPADAAEVAVVAAGKAVDVIDAAAPGGAASGSPAVLHVADADGALRVFDLADPLAPRQIDVMPVDGVPQSVTAGDDGASDVWVAAQSGGVVGFAWR
jgi:hypothetical protein